MSLAALGLGSLARERMATENLAVYRVKFHCSLIGNRYRVCVGPRKETVGLSPGIYKSVIHPF